jgi:hypothetical protein
MPHVAVPSRLSVVVMFLSFIDNIMMYVPFSTLLYRTRDRAPKLEDSSIPHQWGIDCDNMPNIVF